ncbi:hypothetical protein [Ktedonobacter racemifer]|nr:hypothetical protein [Ktedonobacter racemifer]
MQALAEGRRELSVGQATGRLERPGRGSNCGEQFGGGLDFTSC